MELRLLLSAVNVIPAPSNFEFVDLGYDVVNDEVGIVGHVVDGTDRTATVFELNENEDGFTTQTLADLPGATEKAEVSAISSDAFRIAGFSSSVDSVDHEGATWLRSAPSNAVGIGFTTNSPINNSTAVGAWKDGVVGDSGGQNMASIWTESAGIDRLPGTEGGQAVALDASSNGRTIVGFSSHEFIDGAAYYWENSSITKLADSIDGFTLLQSKAKSVSPDGNYIGGEITATDPEGDFQVFPAVWEGPERTLRILTDGDGDLVEGTVTDVSNSGYAVGTFFDDDFINAFGFIWNPEFDAGVKLFEDWLEERQADYSPQISTSVVSAVSEDSVNGTLRFISSDDDSAAFTEVDAPELIQGEVDLDIDGDGLYQPLTDGIVIIRYLAGFRGETLVAGAVGNDAIHATPKAIVERFQNSQFLDVDGDGEERSLTDGILALRYLAGFRGDSLIAGAIGDDATRDTEPAIVAFLDQFFSQPSAGPIPQSSANFASPQDQVEGDAGQTKRTNSADDKQCGCPEQSPITTPLTMSNGTHRQSLDPATADNTNQFAHATNPLSVELPEYLPPVAEKKFSGLALPPISPLPQPAPQNFAEGTRLSDFDKVFQDFAGLE